MSLSPDDQKSVEAIRSRAREMAAGEAHPGTGGAEVLAALADGTVFFEDIPDAAFEGCVDELGADSVVDALMMAAPARDVGVAVKSASAFRVWWRRHFEGNGLSSRSAARTRSRPRIVFPPERPMVPALAAALAGLAIGGAILLTYASVVLYRTARLERSTRERGTKSAVQTADNRPVLSPDVPQNAGAGKVETMPNAQHGAATAPAPAKSGPSLVSPGPAAPAYAPTPPPAGDATTSAIPPITTAGAETPAATGIAPSQHVVASEHQPTTAIGEKSEPPRQPTAPTGNPVTTTREVATTATGERPYIAEYPHLGQNRADSTSQDTTAASQPVTSTPFGVNHTTAASAIQKKLESEYTLTKANYDKTDIVTPGSVVVLHKDKVLMLTASSTNPCRNTYKPGQGQITQSGPCSANEKFKKMPGLLKSHIPGASSVPDSPGSHTFASGEKFWVTKIEVRDSGKDPGILFSLFSYAISDLRYGTTLLVPFEGSIPTPDEALKLVHEVITVATAEDAKKDGKGEATPGGSRPAAAPASEHPAPDPAVQPAEPPPPPIVPPPPPPPDAPEVAEGQTIEQVVAALGQPLRKAKIGTKEIYTYKDLKVTFVNGKVKDIQ